MLRERLSQLSKAALIEIILQQQAVLEQLQARVAQLEEQIKRLTQPLKDCSNSSVPPSQTRKPNRRRSGPKKKRGPNPGHPGTSRERQAPDTIVECRPSSCAHCGSHLPQSGGRLLGTSQVVELPPVRSVVLEARRYETACPHCGHRQVAEYPPGLEPQRVFGPRLEALVCYFHHVQHISYERLVSLFRGLLGLSLSEGAIANIMARAAVGLQSEAEAIRERVRRSPVIGSDETGARVDGTNHWQWVFKLCEFAETSQASYHVIASSRSAREIAAVMGEATAEVWLSDCFSAQLKAPAAARQLCHAHQLRNLQYAVDAERSAFAYRLQRLLLRAQRLAKHRADLPAERFAGQVAEIERGCEELLAAPVFGREARRLQRRYRKHRTALFTFLYRADVPPDNNACERALRKSVVHRKVSGGFRSDWGAEAFATMATVIETAGKRGQEALSILTSLLAPGPPLLPRAQPP
ncbi:MAG: IS66 family transposase [Acidobacteriota bacterium]